MLKRFAVLLVSAFWAISALAQQPQLDMSPPAQLERGVYKLLAFMGQRPQSAEIADYLDNNVANFFNFDEMARLAGGAYYYQITPLQRGEMAEEIKRWFLTELTLKLTSYRGQGVKFMRPRYNREGDEAIVSMYILQPGNYYPPRIDFRLQKFRQGWAVSDVAASGQSAVMHYRKSLGNELTYRQYQAYR
jgi:phospholipid transport system substrate-binding protein